MKTILISAIGGDIAQGVAWIIGNAAPEYRLVGTDTHLEHGGSLFVERFHLVPTATDPAYEDSILKIIEEESVDIVIPVSEPELKVWANSDKTLNCVHWLMLGKDIINTCLDKLETIRCLDSLGVPVPWTEVVSESNPRSFPCILKDRFGSGSKNVNIVHDDSDVQYLKSKYPEAVYQELLLPDSDEITCAVYRNKDKRTGVLQMRRRLSGGLSSWIEVIDDSQVREMCEKIALGIDLWGSINIQLRITSLGPRVFEINPRFSSTAVMRHKLGFCDVIWSLNELKNMSIHFPESYAAQVVVRTHSAELMLPEGEGL